MASLAELEVKRSNLIEQISLVTAAIDNRRRAQARAESTLAVTADPAKRGRLEAQIQEYKRDVAAFSQELAGLNAQLAEIDAQIAVLKRQQGDPKQSVGQTVKEEQTGRAEGASGTNPPPAPEVTIDGVTAPPKSAVPTNAQGFQPTVNVGTDGRVRKLSETQSTDPQITAAPGPARPSGGTDADQQPGGFYGAYPSSDRGAGSSGDDAANSNQTRRLLNQIFGSQQKIVAQDNPLDPYASYSYNISLYLMSPSQYKKMQATKQKNIAGFQLLMQSGGAAQGVLTPADQIDPNIELPEEAALAQVKNLGRNQFFPLDFYIEDVRLKSMIQGRGTRTSHNVFDMQFKVIEPNGISFLDRLYAATNQYMPTNPRCEKQKNYAAQNYLMVIRFYAYDQYGNIVRPTGLRQQAGVGDTDAIIEKWIPFQFTSIKFRVANRLTEYECTAVCPQNVVATGQARGVIPYNVELNAITLEELLKGTAAYSNPAQTGALDVQGRGPGSAFLSGPDQTDAETARLNRQNAAAATSGWTQANIKASSWAARQEAARISVQQSRREQLGITNNESVVEAGTGPTQNLAPPKATAATQKKSIVSGLVDALNQYQQEKVLAGELEYPDVYEVEFKDPILAQAKLVPEGLINKKNTPSIQTQDPAQKLLGAKQSLSVDAQTKSILAGTSIVQFIDLVTRNSTYMTEQQVYIIDAKTGERRPNGNPAETVGWFTITTQIEPLQYDCIRKDYAYKITYVIGPYAVVDPKTDWFPQSVFRGTQKKYNYWYTGENTQILDYFQDYNYMYYLVVNGPQRPKNALSDYREFDKSAFQTAAGESNQGQENNVYGPVATLADTLYSPADTVRGKLTIVGDPDWIQQGPLWAGAVETTYDYRAFLIDGTINYESQEPLFEVLFNQPSDYDLYTGTMDPARSQFSGGPGNPNLGKTSYIYRALSVTSVFSKGRFTQELEGAQVFFYLPSGKTNEATRSKANQTTAGSGTAISNAALNLTPGDIRKLENAQSAGQVQGKVTDWKTGYQDSLPTGARTDSMASQLNASATAPNTQLTTPPTTTAPTSGTQPVGPVSISTVGTGGASGTNVGQPVQVNLYLNNGQVTQVTNELEIRTALQNKQISPQEASSATNRLRIWQNSANNPTTSAPKQQIVRET